MQQLSVIIPTHNRLPRLQHVLAGLERQSVAPRDFEVVVVADGATDGTVDYFQTLTSSLNLRFVSQPNAGVAAARNRGIATATGDLVLLLDDDVVPTPDLVEKHLAAHARHGDHAVVLGPMLSPPRFQMHPWVNWEQQMLAKQYADMQAEVYAPTARQFFTGNTSLLRKHLLEQGGFNVAFRRAEDVELAYRLERAGLVFVFCMDAIGHHYAERSFDSWLATPYAYGQNDVIFWRDLGCDWLLPTIWREYHGRHLFIRKVAELCLDHELLSRQVIQSLQQVAVLSGSFARYAYSAIFNLRYYQGVADQLGGRDQFFGGASRHRPVLPHTADAPQLLSKNS